MPASLEIDKESRLVRSVAWGDVTFDDMRSHQDALLRDPDFDPAFNQLADFSGATLVVASSPEIRMLAEQRLFSKSSRRAFVAPSMLVFGLARMFETYHEMSEDGSQTMVFSNLPAALEWLGHPRDRAVTSQRA